MVLGITSTEPTTYLGSVSLNLGARGEGGIGIERKRGIRVEEKNGEGIERKKGYRGRLSLLVSFNYII